MEEPAREFDQMQRVEIGADWFRNPFGTVPPGKRVRASREGLEVEGRKFVPHESIERAFYAPREGARGRVVIVAKRAPRIAIEVLTRDEAMRLLDALGFGAERRQLTFTSESEVLRHGSLSLWIVVLAMMVSAGILGESSLPRLDFFDSLLVNAAIFLGIGAFLSWFLRPSVVVGTDGIAARHVAFGPRKFISYDDIEGVRHVVSSLRDQVGEFDHVLLVERKSNEPLRVQLKRGERNEDDAAGVVERIEEAMTLRRSLEIPVTVESMLERGDRSVSEWIEALKRIGPSEEVHYRVAAVDRESLFGAVEDPTKKPETRIAAAIALAPKLDDEGRTRLRVSAEAIAQPKLRVALEEVAAGADTDALAKILDDLESASPAEG